MSSDNCVVDECGIGNRTGEREDQEKGEKSQVPEVFEVVEEIADEVPADEQKESYDEIEEEYSENEYQYVYSDEENQDFDELHCGGKRPLDLVEDGFSSKRKYLDADGYTLRLWSEGNVVRMAIVASIRQIIDHQSNKFRILCSSDQLESPENDLDELQISVFVDVLETMTVVYQLTFHTKHEMGLSPPRLKCLTYCGLGTYLFPDHLLPNRFSKFINFGKLFDDLARELTQYEKKMIPFYSITPSSLCYSIQELCYKTQYDTRCILKTSDAVVTGIERMTDQGSASYQPYRKGVGYSVGHEGNIVIDDSYMQMLTHLLTEILTVFPTSRVGNQPNILESPLDEILSLLMSEYSFEDLIRTPHFTFVLLTLIGKLESFYQKNHSTQSTENSSSSSPSWLFSRATYDKIVKFQEIIGQDSDFDYGFGSIQLPPELHDFQRLSMNSKPAALVSSNSADQSPSAIGAVKSENEEIFSPVSFVESFRHHSDFISGRPSPNDLLTPKLLRRLRIEFATMTDSLPETIKLMVLESNFLYSKFMIIGPSDTPYEGGFFLFDMKLPPDYPETNPSVKFLTTGGGTVRFNPNLYNNGKVCLSLLGTWQGEKWDPKISNINQVLQSISFLILVPEPYFNEPGYERLQGTSQGDRESQRYSANIRVQTIRHAVLGHLTHPDPEFRQLIRQLLAKNWPQMREVYMKWANDEETGPEIRDLLSRIDRHLA